MSKIPRPSPRPLRELPITDDAKKAALPLNLGTTRQRMIKVPNKPEEKKKQEKIVAKPKEENKSKQLKKAVISNVALPSTSKGPAVSPKASIDGHHKTLNRSKTESAIQLDAVSTQKNLRFTSSRSKHTAILEHDANAAKKAEVTKSASKLKPTLSFRDKKPSKFDEPKRKQPSIPSKTKPETGKEQVMTSRLKIKRTESTGVTPNQLRNNPNKNMNRSKTEPFISLANVKTKRSGTKNIPNPEIKQQANKVEKEKSKITSIPKQGPLMKKKTGMLSELEDNVKESFEFQRMFHSPQEVPHSGLRFIGRPKKKSMSLKFNITKRSPERTPSEACNSPTACASEETEKP